MAVSSITPSFMLIEYSFKKSANLSSSISIFDRLQGPDRLGLIAQLPFPGGFVDLLGLELLLLVVLGLVFLLLRRLFFLFILNRLLQGLCDRAPQ